VVEPGLMKSCSIVRRRCSEGGVGDRKAEVLDVASFVRPQQLVHTAMNSKKGTTRFSQDLFQDLSHSLTELVISSTPPSPNALDGTAPTDPAALAAHLEGLRSALRSLSSTRKLTAERLAEVVQAAFPPFQGLSNAVPVEAETETVFLLTRATCAAVSVVLGELVDEAEKMKQEDQYWSKVEGDRWNAGLFLLQSESRCRSECVSTD
jgi:hypothetical protein